MHTIIDLHYTIIRHQLLHQSISVSRKLTINHMNNHNNKHSINVIP